METQLSAQLETVFVKADAAAEYLGIKKQTLYKKCQARQIPFFALGSKNYLFKIADLNAYIEAHRVTTYAEQEGKAQAIFEKLETRC